MHLLLQCIQYMVLGISLGAPVGPLNIEVMNRGLKSGFIQSWLVGLGGLSADILFMVVIIAGFGNFLKFKWVTLTLYILGGSILTYMGIQSLKAAIKQKRLLTSGNDGKANAYLTGFMIASTNPISLLFWFGIYGASLGEITAAHSITVTALLSLSILLGLFLWNLNVVFSVHFSRTLLNDMVLNYISGVAGLLLLYFGLKFAVKAAQTLF